MRFSGLDVYSALEGPAYVFGVSWRHGFGTGIMASEEELRNE
jgi:hypothetical protein